MTSREMSQCPQPKTDIKLNFDIKVFRGLLSCCKISDVTNTLFCFLPHSTVAGKSFDDEKCRWRKGGGIICPELWNVCHIMYIYICLLQA